MGTKEQSPQHPGDFLIFFFFFLKITHFKVYWLDLLVKVLLKNILFNYHKTLLF